MRLSNKSTFSLVCFILILALAFAAMPAMAQTIEAEWKSDLDDDPATTGAGQTAGWDVTIAGLANSDVVTVTYLDTAGTAAAAAGSQAGFAAVASDGTSTKGQIDAGIGVSISVQVVVDSTGTPDPPAVTYQRVDFPAGGPGEELPETTLTLRPKLMKLATSAYYLSFGQEVTVTFDYAAAEADENDDAVADLHISDVTITTGSPDAALQIVRVSETNKVTFRSTLGAAGPSGDATVSLNALYATDDTTTPVGTATVTYDDTAPTITDTATNSPAIAAPPGFGTPPDGVWDSVFILTFSASDEANGSGLPDENPVRIDTDETKLDVGRVGLGPADTNTDDTEYLVRITPKADRVTTAGEVVVITIVPIDKAGNEGGSVTTVKLALKAAPPNNAPEFASGASISDITARAGAAITEVTLPEATDSDTGDTLTYEITPALPAGLTFAAATRKLSGTPTATMAETEYTYTVSDGTDTDTLTFDITVNAASVVSGDLTFNISAESYVIIHRSDVEGLPTTLSADSKEEWENMPELDGLFAGGGTLALTITKAADDALFDHDGDGANEKDAAGKYTGKKADGTDGTAPRQYAARDLIITEIMAALNEAYGSQEPQQKAHQWIEIYNPLKVDIEDAKLAFKAGRPAAGAAGTEVLLDRFSNQVGVGWQFTGLGENGFDDDVNEPGDADFVAGRANKDFVSFFRKERGKDGHTKAHWETSSEVYLAGHKGTPGVKERSTAVTLGDPSSVPTSDNVIFNEIGNFADGSQWIEFKNRKGSTANLKNWSVGMVTAIGTEVELFDFPNANINIPAGGVLLVTEKAFYEDGSQLGLGYNIRAGDTDQRPGVAPNHPVRYMKQDMKDMPNGNFLLILRTSNDNKFLKTADGGVQDIAGHYSPSKQVPDADNPTRTTDLWPFYRFSGSHSGNNLTNGKVWRRNIENNNGHVKDAWKHAGFTGGVGYKRNTSNSDANGGTPGYPNDVLKGDGGAVTAPVYISEIMFADDGDTDRLPQWIEITNPSKSVGADLDNWRITIVCHEKTYAKDDYENDTSGATATGEWSGKLEATFLLRGLMIQPNQSVLITSVQALRENTSLPNADIFSVWDNSGNSGSRGATGMKAQGNAILNPYGFYITLHAKGNDGNKANWQIVDTVGNLAAPATDRRGNTQPVLPIAWTLPNPVDENGVRSSIARTNAVTDIADNGFNRAVSDGTKATGWILSIDDNRTARIKGGIYYGHSSDKGSPGQTVGSPLPVNLSFFRPTLEDGKVVIRWTTESELDNAGFNIYRSESRNGEFKQVNEQLIQGKGTTAERSTYKWVDTSAKPGVEYYYQIEDVSFAGEREMLRTTKMKGLISAKDKLTTKWGELKEVQ